MWLIDQPQSKKITVKWLIDELKKFEGRLIIQTMFLRGSIDGKQIDNTTETEVSAWLNAMKQISPKQIMIYSLDRDTPVSTLQKVTVDELNIIANAAREAGLKFR